MASGICAFLNSKARGKGSAKGRRCASAIMSERKLKLKLRPPADIRALAILAILIFASGPANAQQQPESKNMNLVGYNDLQARSAYQPTIAKQGDRYIAYIGHHGGTAMNPLTGKQEPNGTSIVDVTDPIQPKYLAHIPGEPANPHATGESGGAQMARVCTNLPRADKSKFYLLRSFGDSAHEIWDVTDPVATRAHHRDRKQAQRHAQKLVGVRHRHRLSGFRPARLAHAAHDADLRPERSRASGLHPQFRPARVSSPARRVPPPATCTAPSPPARRATASTWPTEPRRTACSRSSTAKSYSPAPRSPPTRTCATRKSPA